MLLEGASKKTRGLQSLTILTLNIDLLKMNEVIKKHTTTGIALFLYSRFFSYFLTLSFSSTQPNGTRCRKPLFRLEAFLFNAVIIHG